MSRPIIEARGLSKAYRLGVTGATSLKDELSRLWQRARDPQGTPVVSDELYWALQDVSFDVRPGEVVGIIGRNGAGKSTLLKILSRITQQTSGVVTLRGRVASLLEVGTGFHPDLTGRENVFLNGAMLGMTKGEIRRKFDEIVAFSEIEAFIDTPVKRYSSGMYVRLAFAVAAHLEPEILIVDEVLAVGDLAFQRKCLGKMGEVSSHDGRTVLFVSHNMSAIHELCGRALLFERGTCVADDVAGSVVARYVAGVNENADVNLDDLPHHGPGRHVRLRRLQLIGGSTPTTTFSMNEPFVARIDVECVERMPRAEIGLKISSCYGSPIHYLTSTWEGLRVDLEPGRYTFEVRVPQLMLFPGTYVVGLWALSEPSWSDDHVQDVTRFSVMKGDVTGHRTRMEQYVVSGGEVHTPSAWTVLTGPAVEVG